MKHSKNKDTQYNTPKPLYLQFNSEFGPFKCDVAASHENSLCDLYFTEEDNALTKEWADNNWMNPPYKRISPWIEKTVEELKKGRKTTILIPNCINTIYFHELILPNARVDIFKGRIAFIDQETLLPKTNSSFGCILCMFGHCDIGFGYSRCSKTGKILKKLNNVFDEK